MDTHSILKRAADKCGVIRHRYRDRNIPTSAEDITVLPFFGDKRSSFILSSMLLRRVREELKGSRYFILVSWPGHEGMYPYVDEYWQVEDEAALSRLRSGCLGFANSSDLSTMIARSLNQHFFDVMSWDDMSAYYSNGLTKAFFERFKHVKVSMPSIPSPTVLGQEVARILGQKESKVFIYPCRDMFSWRHGSIHKSTIPIGFWTEATSRAASAGFYPVILHDHFSYDLSPEVKAECLHVRDQDMLKVMAAMRSCGCVLDFFGDVSRLALMARTPFLCFDERSKYGALKEYEINDLCGKGVRKEYIFGFSTIIESGDRSSWNSNILDHMTVRLDKMRETMDREKWPSSAESNEIVPYDSVRKIKNKKIGSRFVKIER